MVRPARPGLPDRPGALAFGTGGIDGVGLGLSRQKFFYLPEAHNDFILAIIGEEIGLLGTLSVVAGSRSSRGQASASRSVPGTPSGSWLRAASRACWRFRRP